MSVRSEKAIIEATTNNYKKIDWIPGIDAVKTALFDGDVCDVEDTIKSIMQAVKDGEKIEAYYVPKYNGKFAHYMIISSENVIELF